jgi:hypothetical protein
MKTHIALIGLTTLMLAACGETPSSPAALAFDDATPASATRLINTDEDFYCTGSVTGTFENVFVPEGASCTLTDADVKGNILAKERSRLFVLETTTGGNIDAVEAAVLHVRGGRLEGSIQAQDGNSAGQTGISISGGTVLTQGNITITKMNTGTITITDARLLKGNIQVQENTVGARLEVARNTVAQNLEVFVNNGSGSKAVQFNTVQQKLSCKDNTGPFTGRPNSAGEVEGQCRR